MVFTTTTLFKGISCPYGGLCNLPNCIFGHDQVSKRNTRSETSTAEQVAPQSPEDREPASKRRKITYEDASQKLPSKADQLRSEIAKARSTSTVTAKEKHRSLNNERTESGNSAQPRSLIRPISPPLTNGNAASEQTHKRQSDKDKLDDKLSSASKAPSGPHEKLNPRLIPNDPAGHSKRSLYLKHLHDTMAVLNQKVQNSTTLEHKHLLILTEQELIKMTLDEEEKIAREQPMMYANIIKQRMALYKKMALEDWAKQVKTRFARDHPDNAATQGSKEMKPFQTDLTSNQELLILPSLVADQTDLAPFGYVTRPPTEAQAAEAAAAVEASKNWEICDRCSARFQVFPDRNDEGLLASNGPCKHHPNRKVFPQKTKGDTAMGHLKEPYFPCCNALVGSPGCTENEYHVFKASHPGRLAAVLPFITTPENAKPAKDKDGEDVHAVSFDCEMGYTVYGLELIRLTAVAWPSGKQLLDVLVRPLGTIIDLNSRFSGVWPEHFTNAVPYDEWLSTSSQQPPTSADSAPSTLPIISSPQKARALLCTFLTPRTPLIGHAIDNDLNSVRLCHPSIVDTVLLFPHPRGLPMRFGLKMLASRYLGWSIQMGGDSGHDSLEDARATGELVRVKAAERWKVMKGQGWKMEGEELVGPVIAVRERKGSGEGEAVGRDAVNAGVTGKKRRKKFPGVDGGEESTEDEELSAA